MGAVTVDKLTDEVAAELSDTELQALADGDDEGNAQTARDALNSRAAQFGDGKAEELKGEGGEPTGEMQREQDPPEPQQVDVDEIRIDGTAQLDLFNLGGKKATGSSLALTGGKVSLIDGQAFNKGDRIRLTIEAVVNDVGQKDAHDPKTGQVVSCEQRHKARITDMVLESAE